MKPRLVVAPLLILSPIVPGQAASRPDLAALVAELTQCATDRTRPRAARVTALNRLTTLQEKAAAAIPAVVAMFDEPEMSQDVAFNAFRFGILLLPDLRRILSREPGPTCRLQGALLAASCMYDVALPLLDVVAPLAEHGNDQVRGNAMLALMQMGEPALPALTRLLGHREPRIRSEAASFVAQLRAPSPVAIVALEGALGDSDPHVRELIGKALARLRSLPDKPAPPKAGGPASREPRAAEAPASRPVPELVARLGAGSEAERLAAAKALGSAGGEALEALVAVTQPPYGNDAEQVLRREWATVALGYAGGEAFDALVAALEDPAPAVRRRAVTALWRFGAPAVGPLARALRRAEEPLRLSGLLEVIARLGSEAQGLAPVVRRLESHPDATVARAAAAALAQMATPPASRPGNGK